MGRRTKLTPFVKRKLVEYIELGMPISRAASSVGISSRTFSRWLQKGEHPNNGDKDIFVRLVQEIEQAEANFIKKNVERIDKAADKDPTHAQWLLERRIPADFGKRVELEVGPSKVLLALQDQAQRAIESKSHARVVAITGIEDKANE